MLRDFTRPYSAIESFLYDRLIAPAVVALHPAVLSGLLADLPEGAEVLEVGCGGGQLAVEVLHRRGDLRYVGLDLSAEQIARARKRLSGAGKVELLVGSALDLPFDSGRFDAVFSVASIKHWPDQTRGMAECVRVLAPGGQLAIIEGDRGCTLDDARAFVSHWKLPGLFRRVSLPFFRTWVVGQALDLEDARRMLADQPLEQRKAARIEGTPALIMTARAPSAG